MGFVFVFLISQLEIDATLKRPARSLEKTDFQPRSSPCHELYSHTPIDSSDFAPGPLMGFLAEKAISNPQNKRRPANPAACRDLHPAFNHLERQIPRHFSISILPSVKKVSREGKFLFRGRTKTGFIFRRVMPPNRIPSRRGNVRGVPDGDFSMTRC